jgi:type III pantothenate kinase
MVVLLVDIGNTRIKWARFEGGRLGRGRAAAHLGWGAADYARRLFGHTRLSGSRDAPSGREIASLLVSSVAGSEVNRALAAAARRAGTRIRFVRVPRRGGGVTVGYAEPWRLGVDRFVAAVGAHALFASVPVCVVGVGTAMTIDLVGADGRHRGGVIIPGPTLMVETLLDRTHGIRRRARGGTAVVVGRSLFGRSTRAGVVQGARYAAAATIDQAVDQARPLVGGRPLTVLTGGGAPAVRGLVRSPWVLVPDLVLRGLAVLCGSKEVRGQRAEARWAARHKRVAS